LSAVNRAADAAASRLVLADIARAPGAGLTRIDRTGAQAPVYGYVPASEDLPYYSASSGLTADQQRQRYLALAGVG
jgi:hypothetical protein